MNQTVTVNISGIVFHIEVDAYEMLKGYLNKIKGYFENSGESEEIMTDIESRIAELFGKKITSKNQVVGIKDVKEVIEIMGKPEQYLDDESENQERPSDESKVDSSKRLFRDPDDRILGGVASGIALYFGVDAVLVRILFILTLLTGVGSLIYIIFWVAMPEAKTASDKLRMRGEPININNIGKTFEDGAATVNEKLKNMDAGKYSKRAESALVVFFNSLGPIFNAFFRVIGKIIGIVFLIVSIFALVALSGILLGSDTIFSITSDGIFSIESSEFFNLVFVSEEQFHLGLAGLMIMIGVPMVALFYAGIRLLFKMRTYGGLGVGLFVLWVVGIGICAMVGIRIGTELGDRESVDQTHKITVESNHVIIGARTDENPGRGILEDKYSIISLDEDSIYLNNIRLNVLRSETDSIELEVIKYSRGKSRKVATKNAKGINYKFSIDSGSVLLNNYLSCARESKIRGQKVRLKLYLPVGYSVFLDKSLKDILYDVENVTNTWDHNMVGKTWTMLDEGLTCVNLKMGSTNVKKLEDRKKKILSSLAHKRKNLISHR